jgi:hypothetical protein
VKRESVLLDVSLNPAERRLWAFQAVPGLASGGTQIIRFGVLPREAWRETRAGCLSRWIEFGIVAAYAAALLWVGCWSLIRRDALH